MQQGGCPSRNVTANLSKVEAAAHSVSMRRNEGAIVLCDIADAFPSINQQWILLCCQAAAMPAVMQRFLRVYLTRHMVSVRHGQVETAAFHVLQGILQGCVMASWLFVFNFQAVLSALQVKLLNHVVELCAFVDDVAIVLQRRVRESLANLLDHGQSMQRATNLSFNMETTVIMPLTDLSRTSILDQRGVPLQLLMKARYLGIIIGPEADGYQDSIAVDRAKVRIPIIKQLKLGIPLGVRLASITIISALRYALVHAHASVSMQQLWDKIDQSLQAGPFHWMGPLLSHVCCFLSVLSLLMLSFFLVLVVLVVVVIVVVVVYFVVLCCHHCCFYCFIIVLALLVAFCSSCC